MEERDATLAAHQETVLWFEHDLYDQLQLLQVLDLARTNVSLIQASEYLGPMSPESIADLWGTRTPVTALQRELA